MDALPGENIELILSEFQSKATISTFTFSKDCKRIAYVLYGEQLNQYVVVRQLDGDKNPFECIQKLPQASQYTSISWSPDEKRLFIAGEFLAVLEIASKKAIPLDLRVHPNAGIVRWVKDDEVWIVPSALAGSPDVLRHGMERARIIDLTNLTQRPFDFLSVQNESERLRQARELLSKLSKMMPPPKDSRNRLTMDKEGAPLKLYDAKADYARQVYLDCYGIVVAPDLSCAFATQSPYATANKVHLIRFAKTDKIKRSYKIDLHSGNKPADELRAKLNEHNGQPNFFVGIHRPRMNPLTGKLLSIEQNQYHGDMKIGAIHDAWLHAIVTFDGGIQEDMVAAGLFVLKEGQFKQIVGNEIVWGSIKSATQRDGKPDTGIEPKSE